jgi:hypothetical protein
MKHLALGQDIASALGFDFAAASEWSITKIEFALEHDKAVIVRVTGNIDSDDADKVIEKVKNYTMVENGE